MDPTGSGAMRWEVECWVQIQIDLNQVQEKIQELSVAMEKDFSGASDQSFFFF